MFLDDKIEILRKRGATLTIQRYAVLEFLQDCHVHPTAEEIYQGLKTSYPAISRATVYNSLEFLKRHEIIREITIERDKARYDCDMEPHRHFLCRRCGRIYDIDMKDSAIIDQEKVNGHRVEEVKLYIFGTCATCLARDDHA
jgi:Fur family peroxide stress response transcriptional regulator